MSLLFGPLCTHGSGGGSAFNYAALFTSYEMTNGWCIDGSPDQSAFWEDAGGTTACTVSGTSPVGRIDDMLADSGGVGYVVQSTTGGKPIYYVDGDGVRWFRYGLAGGVDRNMAPVADVHIAAAMTVVLVAQRGTDVSGNYANLLSTYNGGWGSGGYFRVSFIDGETNAVFRCNSGGGLQLAVSPSDPIIMVARRSGTGANQTTVTIYDMAGDQVSTATGTQDAIPANPIIVGAGGVLSSQMDCAFQFVGIGAAISAEDEALVVADLVAKFGEWAP